MAILIKSSNSKELLEELNSRIRSKAILSWELDDDGDYTPTSSRWREKAWFKYYLRENDNMLCFGIISSFKYDLTNEIYGVFHGRFAAMLLAFFDCYIEELKLTPMLDTDYDVGS